MTSSEIEQLRAALESRLVIGQAQGLLMERLGIDACQAIGYLKRASNELNRKLVVVAADLVRTRALPLPAPDTPDDHGQVLTAPADSACR